MAYQSQVDPREKGAAIVAVVAIHAVLLLALLNIAGKIDAPVPEATLHVFDFRKVPEPPPPLPPRHQPKRRQKEGGAAPRNLRSEATPVVAPEPQIRIPRIQHIASSVTPRAGTARAQGASDVPGPGTGAGGTGNGNGSRAGGNGPGGGGVAEPPHLASPVLRGNDFPGELLDQWPRGGTVFMRLRIDPRGNVAECMIDRGSGVSVIDASLCNIVHDRLRFRPALDRSGQAVAGWFGYAQPAPR